MEAGSRRVTPGVLVGASLGDILAHRPVGRKNRSPVISGLVGNHPGDCQSGTAPAQKNVC